MPNNTIDKAREYVYPSTIDFYKILLEQLDIDKGIITRLMNIFSGQIQKLEDFPARDLFLIVELKKRKIDYEKIQTLQFFLEEVNKLYFFQRVIFRLSIAEKNENVIASLLDKITPKAVINYRKLGIEKLNANLPDKLIPYFNRIVEENLLTDWRNLLLLQ